MATEGLDSAHTGAHIPTFLSSSLLHQSLFRPFPFLSRSEENSKTTITQRKKGLLMSGGIARGRLTEERKSWRKNHPHVFSPPFN